MQVLGWTIIGLIGLILLLVVGIVAGQVGGIAISKQGAEPDLLLLQLSEPVVRGVPVAVRWTSVETSAVPITFSWRDRSQEYPLGEAALSDQEAKFIFPCDGVGSTGSLVMRSGADGKVLSSQEVELAAPGPECL